MKKKLIIISVLFIMSLVFLLTTELPAAAAGTSGSIRVEFINVGQGDAALIECGSHAMLIDGGSSDASQKIYSVLKERKITTLDYVAATHPDADHIGGIPAAFHAAQVKKILMSDASKDTEAYADIEKCIKEYGPEVVNPTAGDTFRLGSATITILSTGDEDAEEINNRSIVLRIDAGKTSFLFTGDAEAEEESSILASSQSSLLDCDVIKIAHHGSSSSTTQEFLDKVSPKYAVISVGEDNDYGHPTQEVIERLKDSGVTLYRTDLQGDIVCSGGKSITFSVEKNKDADVWVFPAAASINAAVLQADPEKVVDTDKKTYDFVVNIKEGSHKIHSPECESVGKMSARNRVDLKGYTLAQLNEEYPFEGDNASYTFCLNCHGGIN